MSKTKYDDSWYYSDRKIALIDARYDRMQTNNQPSASILQCDI